ncbi:MAG: zinc-ribbon domain-containing protein [Oscillospiraceae bacterium]|nr:zinc-ribbon domain-containing protein [Oscillospiraceae bacterium]
MFCPKCGRQLSDTANFCGGCGLAKAEIEKYTRPVQTFAPAEQPTIADIVTDADFASAGTVADQIAETETVAETPVTETVPVQEIQPAYKAPEASYHYSYVNSTPTQPVQPAVPAKNENLSTVDFIWMLLISSIPVVGLVYLIYLAIQDNNTNKRSYARATLIIAAFAVVISLVFAIGFLIAGVM